MAFLLAMANKLNTEILPLLIVITISLNAFM